MRQRTGGERAARGRGQRRSPIGAKGDESANVRIYAAIRAALLDGRLPPGLKLQEPPIARALKTSRERVRGALRRLAHEGWLTLVPNRGSFVPEPTAEEIEELTAARVTIECATVRALARDPARFALERLESAMEAEAAAAARRDRARQIALSAAFHVLICELAGNRFVLEFQRNLMSRSQLYYALTAPIQVPRCGGPQEHPAIVAAIHAGDAARAARLLEQHLRESSRYSRRLPVRGGFSGFDAVFKPAGASDRSEPG